MKDALAWIAVVAFCVAVPYATPIVVVGLLVIYAT